MIASEEEARTFIREGWGAQAFKACDLLTQALARENARQNLVSRASLDQVWVRHIADSAQLLLHAPADCRDWLDIGTGAGFPGLIVAMLRPDLATTLVEPRRRRAAWLEEVRASLNLTGCRVAEISAQDLAAKSVDVVSARAVAGLEELLILMQRFAHSATCGIFPKGRHGADELASLSPRMKRTHLFHVKQSLTAPDAQIIVCQRAGN